MGALPALPLAPAGTKLERVDMHYDPVAGPPGATTVTVWLRTLQFVGGTIKGWNLPHDGWAGEVWVITEVMVQNPPGPAVPTLQIIQVEIHGANAHDMAVLGSINYGAVGNPVDMESGYHGTFDRLVYPTYPPPKPGGQNRMRMWLSYLDSSTYDCANQGWDYDVVVISIEKYLTTPPPGVVDPKITSFHMGIARSQKQACGATPEETPYPSPVMPMWRPGSGEQLWIHFTNRVTCCASFNANVAWIQL